MEQHWQTVARYTQHAQSCGLDMTGACAVPLDYECVGLALAHKVCDPVHLDVLMHAGSVLTRRSIEWLLSFGLDYVTVHSA